MQHLIDIVAADPALFASLAALLVSELAPFLPTKWNGIAQALAQLLKKKAAPKDGAQ